jgi:two-component system phosphate regulon response regulator PhoB
LKRGVISERNAIVSARHVLIVDDEEDIRELVAYNLTKSGCVCSFAATGGEAVESARSLLPDLIVLDLMLPGFDGYEVCSMLKHDSKTRLIPIIMLTAKSRELDVVRGLEMGADDYVTKPFSPEVLVARVHAALRRRPREGEDVDDSIRMNGLCLHPARHEALMDGSRIELTYTEFKVLYFLARRPGWVYTRSQIIDAVHGVGCPVTDRSVDVQIVGLRKKLGEYGEYIETVRGVGYRCKE